MDEIKTAAVQQEKASPKLMVGYGLGEIGCQMSWYMINNYLNIFYTDVVGLTGAAISAILPSFIKTSPSRSVIDFGSAINTF